MLVPSLLRELVTRPDLMARLSASALRWIVTGAEPVPKAVIETVCRGIPDVDVCQGYGLSEFPTICTVLMADAVFDQERKSGVQGKSVSVRVDLGGLRSLKKKKT